MECIVIKETLEDENVTPGKPQSLKLLHTYTVYVELLASRIFGDSFYKCNW